METPFEKPPIEPRATRLIIEQSSVLQASNESSGERFKVHGITMGRAKLEGAFSYYRLSDLSRTKSVEILMRSGSEMKKIDLPTGMLERIATFIRNDNKRNTRFDCASFAHFVNGIPYDFSQFFPEKWQISAFDENLAPGSTIMISEDPEHRRIVHFGVYLGEGLYLSKFGSRGKLIATTLDEMKKGFGGGNVFQIKPKEDFTVTNL